MAKSYQDLVSEAWETTEQTDVQTVHDALEAGEVHILGAKHLPRGLLEYQAAEQLPNKDLRIVIHCGFWGRSALSTKSLKEISAIRMSPT